MGLIYVQINIGFDHYTSWEHNDLDKEWGEMTEKCIAYLIQKITRIIIVKFTGLIEVIHQRVKFSNKFENINMQILPLSCSVWEFPK